MGEPEHDEWRYYEEHCAKNHVTFYTFWANEYGSGVLSLTVTAKDPVADHLATSCQTRFYMHMAIWESVSLVWDLISAFWFVSNI